MPFRTLVAAALLLSSAPALAAPFWAPAPAAPAKRPPIAAPPKRPAPATQAPPVMFYVAHGAPDSCGRGCDRWIAVEGQINGDAAIRFKQFIKQHLKDRHLPMYFSSPGGNLEQAIFIGNMLRELSATARVARTIVKDCGFEAQTSEVCLKLKRSGRELAGELTTRSAQCNSACPYLILGATTREVAPDAILGVHSAKVVLRQSGIGQPTREMIVAATQRGVERGDRLLSNYVFKMGIQGELLDVAKHTKFEDMHVLTRDQIFRFGIDRREFVETPWAFENLGRALIRKSAIARDENANTWRTLQWRLFCLNSEQFQLDFQREVTATTTLATISISSGGAKPFVFAFPPAKPAGYEVWGLRMPKSSAQAIADLSQIDLTETANAMDGRRLAHGEKLSTEGLAASLVSLQGTCPLPKDPLPKDVVIKDLAAPPPTLPQNSAAK
jgi:hypothetical protein